MTIPAQYITEIVKLRDRVEELEAELYELRGGDMTTWFGAVAERYGLTVTEAKMLWAMSRGAVVSREQLASLCRCNELENLRNIDSHIKRIRKKRMPGVKIKNVYGAGYMLCSESIPVVRRAFQSISGGSYDLEQNQSVAVERRTPGFGPRRKALCQ